MFQSEDKEQYVVYSKLDIFKNRVKKAIEITQKALCLSSMPSLSFSGGKDSVVLLDIAIKAGFKGRLMFFRYGNNALGGLETPKENVELLKYYANMYELEYDIVDCLGESDCWDMCGKFLLIPETPEEKRIFNKTNYDFKFKSKEHQKKYGIDLRIMGMRKEESNARRITLAKKGYIYNTKDRKSLTCCPLSNFTSMDIWAYIFANNLRYLSIYDYPYIDRKEIRNEVTLLYNYSIFRNGMLFHFKQMYPEYFNAIEKKWGRIM